MATRVRVANEGNNLQSLSEGNDYSTYYFVTQFQNGVRNTKENRLKTADDYRITLAANQGGFYFEACFYQAFVQRVNGQNSQTKNNLEFTGSQKDAMNYFNSQNVGGVNVAKFQKFKKTIEDSAIKAADVVFNELMKKFTKITNQERTYYMSGNVEITPDKISISNIAGGTNSRGAEAGDFEIAINGTKHTLELKWQSSAKTMTRWTTMVDKTLFSHTDTTFVGYLDLRRNVYWSHKTKEGFWKKAISNQAFPGFLDENFSGNAEKVIKYLLSKGYIDTGDADYHFNSKYVLHAGYTGLTFIGLPELAQSLSQNAKGKGGNFQPFSSEKSFGGYIIRKNGEIAVAVGLVEYLSQARAYQKKGKRPGPEDFSFGVYISQKQLIGASIANM